MGAMLVRHEPTSAALVRREIAADLDDRGFARDSIEDVTLVASELVGNAVKHDEPGAESELDVTWSIFETHLLLSVSDSSAAEPQVRLPGPDATCGRGMTIIESLSADWGVERLQGGKRVWAKMPLRRHFG